MRASVCLCRIYNLLLLKTILPSKGRIRCFCVGVSFQGAVPTDVDNTASADNRTDIQPIRGMK